MRIKTVKNLRGFRLPPGRCVPDTEIRQLFAYLRRHATTAVGIRDAAIVAVLFGTGMRRASICALDLTHYDAAAGTMLVSGKGNKQHLTYIGPEVASLLRRWLDLRGTAPGPLFVAIGATSNPAAMIAHLHRLAPDSVGMLVSGLRRATGLQFSSHDARRTYISNAIDRTHDLVAVKELVGHAQITTTARYDRRGEEAKKKVAAAMTLPIDE